MRKVSHNNQIRIDKENVLTYLPIFYFVFTTLVIGFLVHFYIPDKKEYIILTAIFTNIIMQYHLKYGKVKDNLVKDSAMRHMWNIAIFSNYAIVLNTIHDSLFMHERITDMSRVIIISLSYFASTMVCIYYVSNTYFVIACHVLFMYFPIEREWIVNLFFFTIYLIGYLAIFYSKIHTKDLKKPINSFRPILHVVVYLNMHTYLLILGLFQLVWEYYYQEFYDSRYKQYDIIAEFDYEKENLNRKPKSNSKGSKLARIPEENSDDEIEKELDSLVVDDL